MSAAEDRLFDRNRRAFRSRFPEIWQRIKAAGAGSTRLVRAGGAIVNLALDDEVSLYPDDPGGPAWTAGQLDGFRELPDRLVMRNPNHCNLSPISMALLDDLAGWLRDNGHVERLRGAPVVDVGFLIVFGVGLGWHLPALIEETPARHIVMIEAYPEFISQSLYVIDWAALFRRARQRGKTIDFVLAARPQEMTAELMSVIAGRRITFADGSYFYCHYYSWVYREAMARCEEELKPALISTGFFEDEIEMITNAAENLQRRSFRLIDSRPRRERSLPVFIVGAGPSLDKDIAELRRLRDRAIVISCGTTLGILLKHGIRPDLHCENERGSLVFDLLSELRAHYSFAGITLLASATVDPRVPDLFDEAVFFLRPSLSSTAILGDGRKPLTGSDPIVCNAAFSAAAALGFRTVYLFGIDLAQKEPGRHHARDSVYFAEGRGALDDLYLRRFDRSVPGNFGGTVQTWWAFDVARQTLASKRAGTGITLFNTSDGARIEGARPKLAATIEVPVPSLPARCALDRALDALERFEAGEMLADLDLDEVIAGCDRFIEALDAALADAEAAGDGFFELEGRLNELVDPPEARERYAGFYFMTRGTVRSMLRLGAFFGTRIDDPAVRTAFIAHFIPCWRQRCAEMAERAKALLTGVRDQVDPSSAGERQRLRA